MLGAKAKSARCGTIPSYLSIMKAPGQSDSLLLHQEANQFTSGLLGGRDLVDACVVGKGKRLRYQFQSLQKTSNNIKKPSKPYKKHTKILELRLAWSIGDAAAGWQPFVEETKRMEDGWPLSERSPCQKKVLQRLDIMALEHVNVRFAFGSKDHAAGSVRKSSKKP